jgi:formyl-CoA transferase
MALPLLKGVRVLELALLMPADHVAGILGDLGAEVIKVEQPPNGDYVRELGGVLAPGISEFHLFFNRNKKSLAINLRTEEGQKVFHELLKTTDVVYESGVPSARKKLRADYESCKATKPDIIYASFPGFGVDSIYSHIPAHGWGVAALSGRSPIETLPDGRLKVGKGAGGSGSGSVVTALSIVAALNHRNQTGQGCHLDISMADCFIYDQHSEAFKALNDYPVKIPQTVPGRSEPVRFTYYKCQDDQVIAFQAVEKKFWQSFCRTVGREDWLERGDWTISVDYGTDDPELEKEMNALFKTKPLDEWIKLLGDADVPVVPGYTIDQVVHSEYAEARGVVDSYEHAGFGQVKQVNFPAQMRGNGSAPNRPAPNVGQDNEDIMQSLGYDAKAIAGLREKGILV